LEPIHIIGAIFVAYIVVKEVFVVVKGETRQIAKDMAYVREFLAYKGEDNKNFIEQVAESYVSIKEIRRNVEELHDAVKDLYQWHNKEDDEGVKIWYVRKSLEDNIKRLPTTLEKQKEVLESLVKIFDQIQTDLVCIKNKVVIGKEKE